MKKWISQTAVDIFEEIPNTNIAAVVISTISIVIMYLNNEYAKVSAR